VIALLGCLLLRDRGLRQSQQSHHCHTHSEGRFHHTHLRETPPDGHGPRPAAATPARRKLPRWQPQCGPQPLTGSVLLFSVRSYLVKNKERTVLGKKRRRPGAPPSHSNCQPVSARAVNARSASRNRPPPLDRSSPG